MNTTIKDILISIMKYSIQSIKYAAKEEDVSKISCELEHLLKVLEVIENKEQLARYIELIRKKYLEQNGEDYENMYECLWCELEQNFNDEQSFILDEVDNIILNIIKLGINNIFDFTNGKDFESVYVEAYHIHNLPSVLTTNKKNELIKYYLEIECKQYLKEGNINSKKKFKANWKQLSRIIKLKKRFFSD